MKKVYVSWRDVEQQVQDICKVSHTPEVISAYQAQQEANKLG